MTHKKRIERLEQKRTRAMPLVIFSSYVNSDGSDAPSLGYTCNGHTVKRESDESDDAMLERLLVLMNQTRDGCRLVEMIVPCWVDAAFADEVYIEAGDTKSDRPVTPDWSALL